MRYHVTDTTLSTKITGSTVHAVRSSSALIGGGTNVSVEGLGRANTGGVAAAHTSTDTAAAERDDPRLAVGLVLFLASESLLFAAFFAAYFTLAGANEPWPPSGTELDVARASIFTAVFVLSAVTMALAVRAARADDKGESNRWLATSFVLGLVFVINTFLELASTDFGITTDAYGSIFFVTIGVHWLHVLAGLVVVIAALVVTAGRGVAPLASSRAAAAYYWYFTVALSVLVLVVFYLIQ